MEHPAISIIVAVYNTGRYIDDCVTSIINQTFKDWELLLIDDGSTDRSGEICDSYAEKDSRIKVIHKANGGQAESRNVGIREAKGKYIGFVDSDDWIESNMYKRLYESIIETGADAAICSYAEEYVNNSVPKNIENVTGLIPHDEIMLAQYYCHLLQVLWSTLFRKEVLNPEIPRREFCEDFAILPHWFNNVRSAVVIDESLYHYRMRKGSLMHIGKNVKRKIIELQLMRERSSYMKSLNIVPAADIDVFEANHYYDVAKDYARNYCGEERNVIVDECSQLLRQMQPYDFHRMRGRIRLRIRILKKSGSWFIRLMNVSSLFSLHYRKQKQQPVYQLFD